MMWTEACEILNPAKAAANSHGLKMTVQEWRNKHRKCDFCKHESFSPCGYAYCDAKKKGVFRWLPRPFCRLFELKEGE